jgi:cytoskeletal protein RodZ
MSIEEIAQTTRIPLRLLHLLEDDQIDSLPGDVFARGYIRSYARTLGLEAAPLIRKLDETTADRESEPAPLPAVQSPERGRRFGIAIALVVLLILFTLALSIVLRPRHRDVPVELSDATPSATSLAPRA